MIISPLTPFRQRAGQATCGFPRPVQFPRVGVDVGGGDDGGVPEHRLHRFQIHPAARARVAAPWRRSCSRTGDSPEARTAAANRWMTWLDLTGSPCGSVNTYLQVPNLCCWSTRWARSNRTGSASRARVRRLAALFGSLACQLPPCSMSCWRTLSSPASRSTSNPPQPARFGPAQSSQSHDAPQQTQFGVVTRITSGTYVGRCAAVQTPIAGRFSRLLSTGRSAPASRSAVSSVDAPEAPPEQQDS
jgi:hypothetical protein